jgi:HK97 family phage major capsid protein
MKKFTKIFKDGHWTIQVSEKEGTFIPYLSPFTDQPLKFLREDSALSALGHVQALSDLIEAKSLTGDACFAGSNIKALGDGRIGGQLVLTGSPTERDFHGQFFYPDAYFGPQDGDGRDVTINHRQPFRTGSPIKDAALKAFTTRLFKEGGLKTSRNDLGIFAETVCNMADEYEAMVYELAERGKLKWSAGAPAHMIDLDKQGGIKMFVISEAALVPEPAEYRMLNHRVMPIKALSVLEALNELIESEGDTQRGDPADNNPLPAQKNFPISTLSIKEKKAMNIMDLIKMLVPGLKDDQIKALAALLQFGGYSTPEDPAAQPVDPANPEAGKDPMLMKNVDVAGLAAQLKSMGYKVTLPGQTADLPAAPKSAVSRPPLFASQPAAQEPEVDTNIKSLRAAYQMRYTQQGPREEAILRDAIGLDYQERIAGQNTAFMKYVRHGEAVLSREDVHALKSMYFPMDAILKFATEGMSIHEIKATQVTAAGELAGFAIPPNIQSDISVRLPGNTVVRASGARVVQLINSNSIEITVYVASDNKYIGLLRGAWGTETQDPAEKNFKISQETIVANIYTYKVKLSTSVVEDAANLVSILEDDIATTMTMDEDGVFTTGNGVGKPRGILPDGANEDGITQIHSGNANLLTPAGIKALKRGIPYQYRTDKAVFVANAETLSAIENLTVGGGNLAYAFPELAAEDKLLRSAAKESENMADVAASALPLLYGNMSGYTIVERLGMSIMRFQDSGTGINNVEYQIRRRIGGRLEKPYMFAVQEVAA